MKVSLIIPTYNKRERLELTLKSLEKQTFPKSDFEVIVTNDGSTDKTREFLDNFCTSLNLVAVHQDNGGQARARNKAIQNSTGDIVIFVDDDVFCAKNLVAKHYENHISTDIGLAVIGKINHVSHDSFYKVKQVLEESDFNNADVLKPFYERDAYLDMRTRIWDRDYRYVKWICFTGANASIPRKFFDEIGMFDENFYGWGPEDAELGYRLFKRKVPFIYDNTIENYHLDKPKSPTALYSVLANNLKYMKDVKYKGIKEISDYISFGSCGLSLEELNHICSGSKEPFNAEEYPDIYFFRPLNYFDNKSKLNL